MLVVLSFASVPLAALVVLCGILSDAAYELEVEWNVHTCCLMCMQGPASATCALVAHALLQYRYCEPCNSLQSKTQGA